MRIIDVLWQCFLQNYHLDHANAAVHTSPVRYSPLTFRLCEVIWESYPNYRVNTDLIAVHFDIGKYPEDVGRIEMES